MFISLFTIVELDKIFDKHSNSVKLIHDIEVALLKNKPNKIKKIIYDLIDREEYELRKELSCYMNNVMYKYLEIFCKLYACIQKFRNIDYCNYYDSFNKIIDNLKDIESTKYQLYMKNYSKKMQYKYCTLTKNDLYECNELLDNCEKEYKSNIIFKNFNTKYVEFNQYIKNQYSIIKNYFSLKNNSDNYILVTKIIDSCYNKRVEERIYKINLFTKEYKTINARIINLINLIHLIKI